MYRPYQFSLEYYKHVGGSSIFFMYVPGPINYYTVIDVITASP